MESDSKSNISSLHDIDGSILGHINDPVSIVDKHYIYRAVSRGYELMFQKPASEIIGQKVEELHGPEVFRNFLKPALDKTLSGEDFEFQFSRPDPNGNLIHIHSKHSVYNGPLTDGPGVAVVARDVTELVHATQALEKERRLLKNIINTLPDFIFAKDSEGVYQVTNRSFEEFLNKPAEEILGKTDLDLMSETSANYVRGIDEQVRSTGKAHRIDEWVTYDDGRRRLLDMHKLPLVTEAEGSVGVLGIGTNVTFERQAEQSRQIASLFFEVTNNPCFVLDSNGGILTTNSAAQNTFNLAPDHKGPIYDLLFCASGETCDIQACMEDRSYWSGEVCANDNQTYVASFHKVSAQTNATDRYVLIIQDPGEQHSATLDLLNKAYEDPLTKLPNRRLFFSKLESAVIRAERQLKKLAVLYIDLNSFKPINDSLGHKAGDEVLIELAGTLSSCFRKTDTFARIGGDEFAALVDIDSIEEAQSIVDKIHKVLDNASLCEQLPDHKITASIGISFFPDDAGSADELLHKADQAMYAAKREMKARSSISNPGCTTPS